MRHADGSDCRRPSLMLVISVLCTLTGGLRDGDTRRRRTRPGHLQVEVPNVKGRKWPQYPLTIVRYFGMDWLFQYGGR